MTMRSVSKQEVIKAADWAAQRAEHWAICEIIGMETCPNWGLVYTAESSAHMVDGVAHFGVVDHWSRCSSFLYAAALEGGPLPAGWQLVEYAPCPRCHQVERVGGVHTCVVTP